jgi:hypothetical protein
MVPMIDSMTVPEIAGTVVSVGPGLVVVGLAFVVAAVWMARRTAEEFRRLAARDWELRVKRTAPTSRGREAA